MTLSKTTHLLTIFRTDLSRLKSPHTPRHSYSQKIS